MPQLYASLSSGLVGRRKPSFGNPSSDRPAQPAHPCDMAAHEADDKAQAAPVSQTTAPQPQTPSPEPKAAPAPIGGQTKPPARRPFVVKPLVAVQQAQAKPAPRRAFVPRTPKTLRLPVTTNAALLAEAARTGRTQQSIMEQALEAHLAASARKSG